MNHRVAPLQIVLSLGLVFAIGSTGRSAQLASSAFSHQYNGDVLPSADGYSHVGSFAAGPSSDGDILTYRNTSSATGYFQSTEFAGAVSNATGWTAEIRLKLDDDFSEAGAGSTNFVFFDAGGYRIFRIKKERFDSSVSGPSDGAFSTASNTDGYHTFRIAREPGSSDWLVWRDGVSVGPAIGGAAYASSDMYFGSGSSGIWGATVHLDYFRFDNTGAYAPVPEPSTCVLLTAIGLAWGGVRTSRKNRD